MLSIDIEELLKNGDSRYELVVATAKRARLIVDEIRAKAAKEEKSSSEKKIVPTVKPVSVAVSEFSDNKWSIVHKKNNG